MTSDIAMPSKLSQRLIESVAAVRCGLMLPPHVLEAEPCDLPGLVNAAVPPDISRPWQGSAGSIATDRDTAVAGAIGEGLERYAAAVAPFEVRPRRLLSPDDVLDESLFALFSDAQKRSPGFPWPLRSGPEDLFAEVWRLADNRPFWAPQELVGLGPRHGEARVPSTSSGLAAHRDAAEGPWLALLRATQEVLERDALAVTWLNGLGGREITLPPAVREFVAERGGEVYVFDLTQRWNPHPVVAVAGGMPEEGAPRHALGIACRSGYAEALDKALLEWGQSLSFAGHMRRYRGNELPREAQAVRDFEGHATFYTLRPDLWQRTALVSHRHPYARPGETGDVSASAQGQLEHLQFALGQAGIDLYYRELTTADVAAAGVRVVRVLSPQLAAIHADERMPFLGGRCGDVEWRYPGEQRHTPFPNPLPHPLG